MKISDLKDIKINESNLKEIMSNKKSIAIAEMQKQFNVNKTIAEYLVWSALMFNLPKSELHDFIGWMDEEGILD